MRVATMALIDFTYLIVSIICVVLAYSTKYWVGLGYIHAILLLFLLYLSVVRIPLVLNWSSNLYGLVFIRIFFFQIFAILTYALSYYMSGDFGDKFSSYLDAVYFSATTWTTLGYGDISPLGNIKLLTSIEALTGLTTLPVFASVVWLYCERRLWKVSQDELGIRK